MNDLNAISLEAVQEALTRNWEAALALRSVLPVDLSVDAAFAIGEATGLLAKAKALVGRDIDQKERDAQTQGSGDA